MQRHRVVGSWSREEWERLPVEARPRDAISFGDGWVQLVEVPLGGPPGSSSERPASESAGESRPEGIPQQQTAMA